MIGFSPITVVYNDSNHIRKTMESVIKQSYPHIEYIIIDGNSNDGTKEAILSLIKEIANITKHTEDSKTLYIEAIHKQNPLFSFKFLSQKDYGIFDAMNKGVKLATKDFVMFVNSRDFIYDMNTLFSLSQIEEIYHCDIIYGHMHIRHNQVSFIKKTPKDLKLLYRLFADFGHSNCIIKTTLHQNMPYNTFYRLAGDYDLIYKAYMRGAHFGFCDIVISSFESGGASDVHGFKSLKEAFKIAMNYNHANPIMRIKIFFYYLYALSKKACKLYLPGFLNQGLLKMIKKAN